MGIEINQNQGPVPLEQPRVTDQSQATKSQGARAGHLTGENLQVGHQQGGNPVLTSGQQGIKPGLIAPSHDPSVATHQAAMGSMDQLVAEWGEDNPLLKDLKQAKSPVHNMGKSTTPQSGSVVETDRGFIGSLDGQNFKVDVADKKMQFIAEGKPVDVQFGDDGTFKGATVNGQPLNLSEHETGSINHFFMLMALFHEMGVEQRQMSRQGRNMANKSVVAKIKAQAQEQRSAATSRLAAGVISGTVKVASGAMSMTGAIKGMKANQAAAPGTNPGDVIAQQWMAVGKMTEGMGEASASALQYQASLHDARSTELRAEEEHGRFIKQTEQDQMQIASELTSKARETFAQTYSQYLQTQSNIARNI